MDGTGCQHEKLSPWFNQERPPLSGGGVEGVDGPLPSQVEAM